MVRNIGYIALSLMVLTIFSPTLYGETKEEAAILLSDGGNAARGKRIFNSCLSCHSIDKGDSSNSGPHLVEIVGRTAGSIDGYKYSSAMKTANFVWSEEKLDAWLQEPRTFLPGNRMTFMGLVKEQERKDLLAYIKQVTTNID